MIDPNILLESKSVQIPTALDAQTQAQNLQNMGNVNRLQRGELAMQPVQLQAAQMENQQHQQDLQDQQNMRRAYTDAGGDLEQTKANAMKYGVSPKTLMALDASVVDRKTKLAALDKETLANRQEKNNQLSGIISPVLSETDPKTQEAKWNSALQIAQQNQLMTAQEAAQHPYPGADGVKLYAAGLTTEDQINKKITAEAAQRRADATAIDAANNTARTNATLPGLQADSERKQLQNIAGNLAGAKSAADYAAVLGDVPQKYAQHFPAAATWDAKATPASVLRIGMTPEQITQADQGAATADETKKRDANTASNEAAHLRLEAARLQQENQNRESVSLSPEARDQMATYFATTGQLPNLGMGAAVAKTRSEIINRASQLFPNVAFASNAANFQANKSSLKNVQGTLDTLSAFENAGLKNLKMFTDAAAKLPDTGVPWLNTPVRMLDEKLIGSQNMSVVNAAREIGLREIARVTNDPKLSGVLSDSARHEVQGFSPANATLPQIMAVAKTLQQDMANVHSSLTDQRDAINNRIGTDPTAKPAPAAPVKSSAVIAPHGIPDIGSTFNGGKVLKVTRIN